MTTGRFDDERQESRPLKLQEKARRKVERLLGGLALALLEEAAGRDKRGGVRRLAMVRFDARCITYKTENLRRSKRPGWRLTALRQEIGDANFAQLTSALLNHDQGREAVLLVKNGIDCVDSVSMVPRRHRSRYSPTVVARGNRGIMLRVEN